MKSKSRKKFLPLYVFVFIAGTGIFLFGLLASKQLNNSLITGFCSGFGIVLLSSGISKTAHCLAMTEQDQKKLDVEMKDERNSAIREKAAWSTGNVIIPLMGISGLALALTNNFVGACVIAGILLVYSLTIVLFSSYYSKKL